ncbi:uncharacterized protein EV420DRAFT_1559300, partial [Desarmillaria tabescens]
MFTIFFGLSSLMFSSEGHKTFSDSTSEPISPQVRLEPMLTRLSCLFREFRLLLDCSDFFCRIAHHRNRHHFHWERL